MEEQADGLLDAIFINREVLFSEIGDGAPAAIANGGVQDHEIDVHREFVGVRLLTARLRIPGKNGDEQHRKDDMRPAPG